MHGTRPPRGAGTARPSLGAHMRRACRRAEGVRMMKRTTAMRLLALFSLGVLIVAFQVLTAGAAPGDGLATVSTAPPCTGDIKGIGVAFDGNDILFTCANEAQVHRTNLAGAN